MIFADASAIVAILLEEPEALTLLDRLAAEAGAVFVSPLVRIEVVFALAKDIARRDGSRLVRPGDFMRAEEAYGNFLESLQAEEVALTPEIGQRAVQAARTYGKLVRHPAQLNMGDCFAHACAKALGAALLYKGDDFARTDLA